MRDGYSALARVYDRLNDTVDYKAWADFIEDVFSKYSKNKPCLVLDLGCGTGSMTLELSSRGYDMTALDLSEDMLSVAEQRARNAGDRRILFIRGDMCSFELYGTVDAVVCCLDGINHLLTLDDIKACFSTVENYLNPGGLFVFDMNSRHKFRTVYNNRDYVLEEDGVLCTQRIRLNKRGDMVDFFLTVFEEMDDGTYFRSDGTERERAYSLRTIEKTLAECGFELVDVSGDYGFTPISDETDRYYFTARKK